MIFQHNRNLYDLVLRERELSINLQKNSVAEMEVIESLHCITEGGFTETSSAELKNKTNRPYLSPKIF